jgi:hypothetical protein
VSIRYSNNGSSRKMEKDQAHAAWDAHLRQDGSHLPPLYSDDSIPIIKS